MQELREATELREVSVLDDRMRTNNTISQLNRDIGAKKRVLRAVFAMIKEEKDTSEYVSLMRFYQVLLAETNSDELAYEVMRLVNRHNGNKQKAAMELNELNEKNNGN